MRRQNITHLEHIEAAPGEVVERERDAGNVGGRSARYRADDERSVFGYPENDCRACLWARGSIETETGENDISGGELSHYDLSGRLERKEN